MPMLFVSHSSKDEAKATLIHDMLEKAGFDISVEDTGGLEDENPNAPSQHGLEACDAGVFIISAHSNIPHLNQDEIKHTLDLKRWLFILNLDGTDIDDILLGSPITTQIDVSGDNFTGGIDHAINCIRAHFALMVAIPEPEKPSKYNQKMNQLVLFLKTERKHLIQEAHERHQQEPPTTADASGAIPEDDDPLTEHAPGVLTIEAYQNLHPAYRRMLEALAIYNVPVEGFHIEYLLAPWAIHIDVSRALQELVNRNDVLFNQEANRYSIRPADRDIVYAGLPVNAPPSTAISRLADRVKSFLPGSQQEKKVFYSPDLPYTRFSLEHQSATYYTSLALPQDLWHSKADLSPQLTGFRHHVAAKEYDAAAALLDRIDFDYLMQWGHSQDVVPLREGLLGKITVLPQQTRNHYFLAAHYQILGRIHEAHQELELNLNIINQSNSNDRSLLAAVLSSLGNIHHRLGEMDKAIDYYQQTLDISYRIGEPHNTSMCLSRLGEAYEALGESYKALYYYLQALTISREIENQRIEEIILVNLSKLYRQLEELDKVIDYRQQALDIARQTSNRHHEGSHLVSLGLAYYRLDELEKAIDYDKQALDIVREIGDRRMESTVLGVLGSVYSDLDQIDKAIDHYEQALAIDQEIGDRRGERAVLGNLGSTYYSLGQIDKAIDYYKQALTIVQEIDDRKGEGAILGNMSSAYYSLGQINKAIEYYKQALAITQEIGDRRDEGVWLGNLGLTYSDLGQIDKAIDYYEQALALAQEIGNRRGKGVTLSNLGLVYYRQGEIDRAIDHYQQAQAILHDIGERNSERNCFGNLGLAYTTLGELDKAIDYYRQALDIDHGTEPSYAISWRNTGLGWALLISGDEAGARDAFTEANNLDAPMANDLAAAGLGVACLRLGDDTAAEAAFTLAVTRCDDLIAKTEQNYEAWYTLGLARAGLFHLEREEYAAAGEAYRRAVEIAPHAGILADERRHLDELAKAPGVDGDQIAALRAILTP